ncbi:MAG TPA: DUF131 domain-containing protein [Thermoplasmata archaeon]|nr:DUF131 domain-containing protein [Thermoplasmata archaeon]
MRLLPLLSAASIAVGVALLADAVARGAAHLTLVVIIPVFSGSSAEFLAGSLLLVLGIFTLPFSLAIGGSEEEPPLPATSEPPEEPSLGPTAAGGGVILVGPFPIFFGGWKGVPRRVRWAAALVGVGLTLVALAIVLWVW